MSRWQRICCAVDLSHTSWLALKEAADLARRDASELMLVHVLERPAGQGDVAASVAKLLEQKEAELKSWRVQAEQLSGRKVRAELIPGDAAGEICRFAKERAFDLLVVGTHGWSGIRHFVAGSVAEKVVREAHCPVLVVRPTEKP
jgi:universal stress protein A